MLNLSTTAEISILSFITYLNNFPLKPIRVMCNKNRNKLHASLLGSGNVIVSTVAIRFVKQWRESNMEISQVVFYKWLIGHKLRCAALQLWCWTVEYLVWKLKETASTVESGGWHHGRELNDQCQSNSRECETKMKKKSIAFLKKNNLVMLVVGQPWWDSAGQVIPKSFLYIYVYLLMIHPEIRKRWQ